MTRRSGLALPNRLGQLVLASAAAGFLAIPSQAGVIISYPDFSSTAGLTLVGNAATAVTGDGAVLRVTPSGYFQSGAAYSTTPVTLGASDSFSTTFDFRFSDTGGIDPADGITFVLAASPAGLGVAGGDLGYGGVGNSVAVEFDTYDNAEGSSNHVAIDTDGLLNDLNLINLYGQQYCDFSSTNLRSGCLSNGDLWSATISYDGTNLSASVWDLNGTYAEGAPMTVYSSLPIDIASYLGTNTAYVGFTGGTGSGYENQDILNWQFADTTQLGVPEPATVGLLFGGMAGFALVKRRRGQR